MQTRSHSGQNGAHAKEEAKSEKSSPNKGSKRKILHDLDEWEDLKKIAKTETAGADSKEADTDVEMTVDQYNAKHNTTLSLEEYSKKLEDGELGKPKSTFRNYVNSAQQERVSNFYKEQHEHQTFDFVKKMEEKYLKLDKEEMGIWEMLEMLSKLVDQSDPDTDLSQLQHALQTAESIRKKYPGEEYDWFALTGLIHDLGKIMALSPKMKEPQWAVVGDTFPVGCQFSDKIVFPQTFDVNPDAKHKVYSTKLGIYKEHCGLSKLHMSWGHDEYLYHVCVKNGSTLPKPALYMIRYHSFYPWHREGAYSHFMDKDDEEMLKWVKEFNQFDLYSKADSTYDPKEVEAFYKKAIAKYFPAKLKW